MRIISLQRIDESIIDDYPYLDRNDMCYFLGDYAGGQGFQYSEMNQLINNLKKPMERQNREEWQYKEGAILEASRLILSTKQWENQSLKNVTWVPNPPSKKKDHPEYDDRLIRILQNLKKHHQPLDMRELLLLKNNRIAAHNSRNNRLDINGHLRNLEIDESMVLPLPSLIILFDDIIATGAGFKAAQKILKTKFPDSKIVGIFIARNIRSM